MYFTIMRKLKEPFGQVGEAAAGSIAEALGASPQQVRKAKRVGRSAGRIGGGAVVGDIGLGLVDDVGEAIDAIAEVIDS